MITPELKVKYPSLKIAHFTIKNLQNKALDQNLEAAKRETEAAIRLNYLDLDSNPIIADYDSYFKTFGQTYPIRFQLKTILSGKSLPARSCVLEAMFMAELKNCILTAGHDLAKIQGTLTTTISAQPETYQNISGKTQAVPIADIYTTDSAGIISCISLGPDLRTKIAADTKDYLFFAYAFGAITQDVLKAHMQDIIDNLRLFANTDVQVSEITVK